MSGEIQDAQLAIGRGTEALEVAPLPTIESMLNDFGEGIQGSLDPLKQRLTQVVEETTPLLLQESNKAIRDAAKGRMSYLAAAEGSDTNRGMVNHAFACHAALERIDGRAGMMGGVAARALGLLAELDTELKILETFRQRSLADIRTAQEERQAALDCANSIDL